MSLSYCGCLCIYCQGDFINLVSNPCIIPTPTPTPAPTPAPTPVFTPTPTPDITVPPGLSIPVGFDALLFVSNPIGKGAQEKLCVLGERTPEGVQLD